MIFSTVVAVSVLSLFSFTRAATIHARGDSCAFVCPDKDLDGDTLVGSTRGAILSCSYTGKSSKWCTYNAVSSIPPSYFYPPRLTMLPRPLECPWAIAIAPRPQFKNASDATAGSSSRQLSVEAVTTTTEIRTGKFRATTSNGSAAGPRVQFPSAIRPLPPRIGIRPVHRHGTAHTPTHLHRRGPAHTPTRLQLTLSLPTRLPLSNHATSDALSKTSRRAR